MYQHQSVPAYHVPLPHEIQRRLSLGNQETFWLYGKRISKARAEELHATTYHRIVDAI